jgi:hypothetical protein
MEQKSAEASLRRWGFIATRIRKCCQGNDLRLPWTKTFPASEELELGSFEMQDFLTFSQRCMSVRLNVWSLLLKCRLVTSGVDINWNCVGNADSQATPMTTESC